MSEKYLKENLFKTFALKKSQESKLRSELNSMMDTQENQKKLFEILKEIFKNDEQQPDFRYFLKVFLIIKRRIRFSPKKNLENIKEFFNIYLVYARKYTPVHFNDSTIPIFDKLCTVIRDVPQEVILDKFQTSSKDKILLTHLILNVIKKPELIKEELTNKFVSDYLIDVNKQSKNGFKFSKLYANLLDQQIFKEKVLPNIQRLLKRSDNNIMILAQLLNANIDFTPFAEEIVIKNIAFLYANNDFAKYAFPIANKIVQNVKDNEVQLKIAKGLIGLIKEQRQGSAKFEYLKIICNLAVSAKKNNDELISVVLDTILQNLSAVLDDTKLYFTLKYIETIFDNASAEFKFSGLQNLIDLVSSAKSDKYKTAVVSRIATNLIQRSQDDCEQLGLKIFNELYLFFLKENKKLVTQSQAYVTSFEASTESLKKYGTQQLKDGLKKVLPQILDSSLYTNQFEYFSKNIKQELKSYLTSLVNIFYQFSSNLDEKTNNLLGVLIIYIILDTNCPTKTIEYLFKENSLPVFQMLIKSSFVFFYLVKPNQIEYFTGFSTKNYLLQEIISRQLQNLTEEQVKEIKDLSFISFQLKNKNVAHKKFQKRFDKFVQQNYEVLSEAVKNNEQSINPYLLNSELFIQNRNPVINNGARSISLTLFKLGQFELFLPYKIFFDKENYENSEKLEEFKETSSKNEEAFTEAQLEPLQQLIFSLNLIKNYHQQAEDSKPNPNPKGKPNPNPNVKKAQKPAKPVQQPTSKQEFIMLDEEQLLAKQLRELRIEMIFYYRWSVAIFELIGQSGHSRAPEFFFTQLFEGFMDLCSEEDFQESFLRVAVDTFKQVKIIGNQFSECLAQFFIKYSENKVPKDKILESFHKFQENLVAMDFNNEIPFFILKNINVLQKYILSRGGFDMQMKKEAINYYIKLDENKYENYVLEIFDPLNENINILSSQPNIGQLIDKLMLNEKLLDKIPQLFNDILNGVDKAKIAVLNSLLRNHEKLKFQPTFDVIIKLRILMIDDNQEVQQLAKQTLDNFPHEINISKIDSFDLITFVQNHSRENAEKFTQFANELIKEKGEYSKVFFKKVVHSSDILYDDSEISEEALLFFPHFLNENMQFISGETMEPIFISLVEKYTGDSKQMVSAQSLQAGIDIIQHHGASHATHITTILEKFLKSKNDQHQLSAIIFLGVIAPFIKNKSSVDGVSGKIMNLFEKGSENMQRNLARCMPELINFFDNPKKIAQTQLQDLQFHSNPEMKRGCSYLIAGLNKGLGIEYLDELKIFDFITQEVKKEQGLKESILYLIQAYLETMGRVIEPFIIQLAQTIMKFFTDRNEEIRDLALNTIKIMMQKLTAYGVKIVLPQMLLGLEETQWQAKVNNIWSLGNMAYCSAKQLSQCLPQIVPKLSHSLSDTHPAIREAANDSLKNIGSTIQNPEISEIVDILIQALSDPFEKNRAGLKVLLETKFEHYIDAPSLSLVIPILDYALKQKRDPEAKIDACQVIGSISNLIKDINNLIPYMQILVEGLHSALSDPDNDVRTFGSKAVGKLAEKLGEKNTETYFKFVQESIEKESTPSIERGGVASALAEIMCNLTPAYFNEKLQEIFRKMKLPANHMKEGYIGVFVYLPVILKDKFKPFIKLVLDNTVEFCTHENDKVRDMTLRVLRILIQTYGLSNTDLLMQPINEGMFSTNWRKRNSALLLSSEMLEVLTKYLKVADGESWTEDQVEKNNQRNENIMGVYILRADDLEQIKNLATSIWKNYIDNTPKTLKNALDVFLRQLCKSILQDEEIIATTKRSLGEFSGKYGESFFPQIMDEVTKQIEQNKTDAGYVTGVLLVMREIILQIPQILITRYMNTYISWIQQFIFSQDKQLRQSVFIFYKVLVDKINSVKILDFIIKDTYEDFKKLKESDEKYGDYLDVFNQIVRQKSQKILSYIIPFLFKTPLLIQQIDIITNNADIVGHQIYKSINDQEENLTGGCEILLNEAFNCQEQLLLESQQYCLEQLSINLSVSDMIKFFQNMILKLRDFSKSIESNTKQIQIILSILNFYYFNTAERIEDFNTDITQYVLPFIFLDTSKYGKIVDLTNKILLSFYRSSDKKIHFNLLTHTEMLIKNKLSSLQVSKDFLLPGFNYGEEGDGIAPYIDMIISCLVYNSDKEFDGALELVRYIITHTDLKNLDRHIMRIVGPLIRVINYKYDQERKEVIVSLFKLIKDKKMKIEAFTPQLQSTYIKLIQEFPREQEFVKDISKNMIALLQFTKRNDLLLHDMNRRYQDETNVYIKEAYLSVLWRYVKYDISNKKSYFAQAIMEKLFDSFLKETLNLKNYNTNLIFLLGKFIGQLSYYISPKKLALYQKEAQQIAEEASELPINIFFYLNNLINIYLYNPMLNGKVEELGEEWSQFKPLENIQELICKNVNNFEREWTLELVEQIRKNITQKLKLGKYLAGQIKFSQILASIDQEWVQNESSVNLELFKDL